MVLVAAQFALALILLIGAGLLVNSFMRLAGRDLNFEPDGLLTLEVRSPVPQLRLGEYRGSGYFEMTVPPWQKMEQTYDRLRVLPGAASVGGISYPPVDSLILPMMDVSVEGRSTTSQEVRPPLRAAYFLVTPNFFQTMKTPFVRGRDVVPADTVSRPWVAVVNEAAARRFWPGEDPIGRRLTIDVVPEELPREVVGVVRNIPLRHGETEPHPVIYASYLQQPSRYRGPFGGMFGQMTFVLRPTSDPLSLVPAARRAIAEVEPDRPIGAIMTAAQRLDIGRQKQRYNVFLVGILAATAAILAAVGVYGMLAYVVGQRTREIGIRKTLGAGAREVVMLVGRHALTVVLAGLIVGWAGAFALTRLIASQLWGITPTDLPTFVCVSLLLVSAAFVACLGPTRRAIAVDPTIALRQE
jgi:putative ABC transport system permease protein